MFKHTIEVKLSFVETKERNKKGKPVKRPVVHRKMLLSGMDPVQNIKHWRIVARNRKVPVLENGVPKLDEDGKELFTSEARFSTSYLPLSRASIWDAWVEGTKWIREKEPNGKVTPSYNLEGVLKWLSWRHVDPVGCLTELLTAVPVKDEGELEEAA